MTGSSYGNPFDLARDIRNRCNGTRVIGLQHISHTVADTKRADSGGRKCRLCPPQSGRETVADTQQFGICRPLPSIHMVL